MDEKDIRKLEAIYPQWSTESTQRISPLTTLNGNLQDQLNLFYQHLLHESEESLQEPIRKLFANWHTLIQKENAETISQPSLVGVIKEICLATQVSFINGLKEKEANTYFDQVYPLLLSSMEIAHEIEINALDPGTKTAIKPGEDLLAKVNLLQSEFFHLTSETLITPITLIEGYATMIETQISSLPERNSELEMLSDGLKNGVTRLTNLVDEMSYLALIDQKRLEINKQPISINQFLQKLERDFRGQLSRRHLSLTFRVNNTDQIIHVDMDKLLYAIKILLHYAISTTPDEGNIEIITDTIQDKLQIQIIDDGLGLTAQQKGELFNKLRKSDPGQQAARKFSNISGNGMYIAKGILQGHFGSLWVDSPVFDDLDQPGKRFNLLVPIK